MPGSGNDGVSELGPVMEYWIYVYTAFPRKVTTNPCDQVEFPAPTFVIVNMLWHPAGTPKEVIGKADIIPTNKMKTTALILAQTKTVSNSPESS
jgi:hypothetical protein